MKRVIALLVAVSILLGVASVSAEEEPVTIHLLRATFNLKEADEAQVKKVEDAINAYIADRVNFRIKITEIGSDSYGEQAEVMLKNKELNLLWTASWEDVVGVNDLVAQGAVYDLTNLLPGTRLYSSMSEKQWEATQFNGKNYFIPVYKDMVEGYDFMFRKDLADKYGWDVFFVRELKDLEPMLKDAKKEGLKYPFLTQSTSMFYRWYIDRFDFFTADVNTNFFAIDRKTNEVINTIQTPEYAEFCKLMGEWAEKGYISPDEVTHTTSDTTTQTKDWAISWWTDVPVNAEASVRYNQDVIMQMATRRYSHSTSTLGSCYCITENCTVDQAKAAIEFLGLLYTDKTLADIYTYGIEGEDFDYTQTEKQAIKHVTPHSSKYNHSMWESASASAVSPVFNEPDIKADLYLDFNANAITSCAQGFRFDKIPVQEAYDACMALFKQYGHVLENGGVKPKEVDGFIAEYQAALDAAGYQEALEEFQRQYDAWKNQ